MNTTRTLVVDQHHPAAADSNPGSAERPFRSLNAATALAQPGDTVLVMPGVYRERVSPARSGEPGRPIVYQAAPGHQVFLRGSDALPAAAFSPVTGHAGVFRAALPATMFGTAAYHGVCDPKHYAAFNPYLRNFNREVVARPHSIAVQRCQERVANFEAELAKDSSGTGKVHADKKLVAARRELAQHAHPTDPRMMTTLGQIFVDGQQLLEVERPSELHGTPGTWLVGAQGDELFVHFPAGRSPAANLVELTTRHTVFAPLKRGLSYIAVRGFVIEHGANHFPTWGKTAFPQVGLLSCRSGHHWDISGNIIRHAKGLGIDLGQEGGDEVINNGEFPAHLEVGGSGGGHSNLHEIPKELSGHHQVLDNHICDNGHCGIAGIHSWNVRIAGNVIERNNRTGYTSPWWEFAGIKLHFAFDAVIEGNLIRDNECHGIWLDNQFRGSRVTRNVIVNNLWSGVNVELGRGPVTVDHNVIAYTRKGDAIYGHDIADVQIAHNLLYCNAGHGVWMAYCTPRVKAADGCWDINVVNNLILGNNAGAVGLPLDWACAGNNRSDGNLLMGPGEPLDEGSGPFPPRFIVTNKAHCGQFPGICQSDEVQTAENVAKRLGVELAKANVPKNRWPNLERWSEDFALGLDLWQAITGNDTHSAVCSAIRDGLGTRTLSWWFSFDQGIDAVTCAKQAAFTHDFHGRPMPATPKPGPFQDLTPGENRILLWPVPGVPTTVPVG